MSSPARTPHSLGYRMPAEWEPHEATWIAWPHNQDDWPGRFEPIRWVYAEIVRKLTEVERVRILVQNVDLEQQAREILRKAGAELAAVEFFTQPTDRVWVRDFGPLFVRNREGRVGATKWRFNGWAKYENHVFDEAAGHAIAQASGVAVWFPDTVMEGGSVDVNGQGLLLTTEECLLSPVQARNPHLTREQIERELLEYLGTDRVLWLKNGVEGDDTHGHIDDVARFTSPDEIVMVTGEETSAENFDAVKPFPLRVRELPMPEPLYFEGQRLPASYANFYVANGLVLVPTFNDPNDRIALNTLAQCFPDRRVTGINCVELIWGLGALHCMTQQQPAEFSRR